MHGFTCMTLAAIGVRGESRLHEAACRLVHGPVLGCHPTTFYLGFGARQFYRRIAGWIL